jgi:fatty acid desaturase
MLAVGEEIPGLDLEESTRIDPAKMAVKVLILTTLLVLFLTFGILARGLLLIIPIILLGLIYAHAVELQHQCLHNTGFRSTRLNRFAGVLLGVPTLVSFCDYQASHFQHHKLLGTPRDKEFFNYGYDSLTSLKAFIPHLFMLRHYQDVATTIVRSFVGVTRDDIPERTAKRIRAEYLIMAVFLVMMAAITIALQTPIFLKLWLLPLLVAIPTHALIELPEHIGCENATTDVLRNTRTIRSGKLAVWFTNANNYHVEHHWQPGVPNDKLPDLHNGLAHRITHLETSYWSFYWWFLGRLYERNLGKLRHPAKGA